MFIMQMNGGLALSKILSENVLRSFMVRNKIFLP